MLKQINAGNSIKYPIKVDLALAEHKRSLLIQAELGGQDFPLDEAFKKHQRQLQQETNTLFTNLHRLIRCIIDIQIHKQDAVAARNCLELARTFDARAWDDSPLPMKQIKGIGDVFVRKLAANSISSLEDLESTEPSRIELLLSKNPPFGTKLLALVREVPKVYVSMKLMGKVRTDWEAYTRSNPLKLGTGDPQRPCGDSQGED